ncbi:hypothetical protein BH11PSE11_BH11PSE11_19410 [soil metagenome]
MPRNVFTYGSLMFPQVWERVVSGSYRSAAATLAGHARLAIVGETYPGMIARDGGSTRGVVYFDVHERDVAVLDAFEGGDYRRVSVGLQLEDGELAAADTYLYLPVQRLASSAWVPEDFQVQRFLGSC